MNRFIFLDVHRFEKKKLKKFKRNSESNIYRGKPKRKKEKGKSKRIYF